MSPSRWLAGLYNPLVVRGELKSTFYNIWQQFNATFPFRRVSEVRLTLWSRLPTEAALTDGAMSESVTVASGDLSAVCIIKFRGNSEPRWPSTIIDSEAVSTTSK
jgi:hypothetical protein